MGTAYRHGCPSYGFWYAVDSNLKSYFNFIFTEGGAKVIRALGAWPVHIMDIYCMVFEHAELESEFIFSFYLH